MPSARTRRGVAAFLASAALTAGCSPTAATAIPAAEGVAVTPPPGQALDIARRHVQVAGVPHVVGEDLETAREHLAAVGARVRVVAFAEDATVSDQYPRGGQPPARDGTVTVWLGSPAALSAPEESRPTPLPDGAAGGRPPQPSPAPEPSGAEDGIAAAAEAAEGAAAVPTAPAALDRDRPGPAPPPADGRVLEGTATWYGPGFAGNRTACGGRFDPDRLTMASRELPCGTEARVTGPDGRHVQVRVTDWGPAAWTGHRFDLSAAAFTRIADPAAGVLRVRVEVLGG